MPSGIYHSMFWQDQGAPPAEAPFHPMPYAKVHAGLSLSAMVLFLKMWVVFRG